MSKITRAFGTIGLFVKKNDHAIMHYAGLALITIGAATAVKRATSNKMRSSISAYNLGKAAIKADQESGLISAEDAKQNKFELNKRIAKEVVKEAALPAVEFGVGLYLNQKGYLRIVGKKNHAVEKLLATSAAFAGYRAEVKKSFGDEFDQAVMDGEQFEVTTNEDGSMNVSIRKDVDYDPDNNKHLYSFTWGPGDENYTGDLEMDTNFLNQIFAHGQYMLNFKGHYWLSDLVKEVKGNIPKKMAKELVENGVGWIYEVRDGNASDPTIDCRIKVLEDNSYLIFPNVTVDLYERLNLALE